MPTVLKLNYIMTMWVARLEFMSILALISYMGTKVKRLCKKLKFKSLRMLLIAMISVLGVFTVCSGSVSAQETFIPDGAILIEQAKALDGQVVVFQGEVIGDMMRRQDHYWINVSGNGTAIGVWITAGQRKSISLSGQYGVIGDEVKIIGRFSQACPEHGGDLDIHAISVEIVSPGAAVADQLNTGRLALAAALLVLALIALVLLIRHQFRHQVNQIKQPLTSDNPPRLQSGYTPGLPDLIRFFDVNWIQKPARSASLILTENCPG